MKHDLKRISTMVLLSKETVKCQHLTGELLCMTITHALALIGQD